MSSTCAAAFPQPLPACRPSRNSRRCWRVTPSTNWPSPKPSAIAAHFIVEEQNLAAIRQMRDEYERGGLRARLARYHRHVDVAFHGWNDSWLHPDFRKFDITSEAAGITVPILAMQGADDPYGTVAQLDVLRRHARAPLETVLIPGARHAPHLEAKEATLAAIARFTRECVS